jgi:hypothetical protein
MITTVSGLQQARACWLSKGMDSRLFDVAVTALNAATTNVDVKLGLPSPTYFLEPVGGADPKDSGVWRIYANGEPMLEYKLREISADAEVAILP